MLLEMDLIRPAIQGGQNLFLCYKIDVYTLTHDLIASDRVCFCKINLKY